jgi:hypothetical protein
VIAATAKSMSSMQNLKKRQASVSVLNKPRAPLVLPSIIERKKMSKNMVSSHDLLAGTEDPQHKLSVFEFLDSLSGRSYDGFVYLIPTPQPMHGKAYFSTNYYQLHVVNYKDIDQNKMYATVSLRVVT